MSNLSIQRVLALPGTLTASTMYIVQAADADKAELYFSSQDGSTVRHIINKADITAMITAAVPAIAASATKLQTARNISASGDAAWTVSFDGSADATAVLTLTATGIAAGEHLVYTVDAKGRAVSARALAATDIPLIPGSKINSDITVNTSGNAATATLAANATKLANPIQINGVNFDGSAPITVPAVDTATPRIANSKLGVPNGVATLDSSGLVLASQLPGHVDEIQELANLAAFPATGATNVLYLALDTNKVYRWAASVYIQISVGTGTADSALKLFTSRSIAATGDGSWTVNFDGSANVTAAFTLANVVTAGEYPITTVDAKGRTVGGRAIAVADIPTLDSTKVISAASVTLAASAW